MARELHKQTALLHLTWCVATCDGAPGAEKNVTPEEDRYLDLIRKEEDIDIDWDDFNAKRKSLNGNEEIIAEACKALRMCGMDWRIKCLGYMKRMAWVSQETDLENNMSDEEWELILSAQRKLKISDEDRNNAHHGIVKNKTTEVEIKSTQTLSHQSLSKLEEFELNYNISSVADIDIEKEAALLVILYGQGSCSLIMRKLLVGYDQADEIIDKLEEKGLIGPFNGAKGRVVELKRYKDDEDELINDVLEFISNSDTFCLKNVTDKFKIGSNRALRILGQIFFDLRNLG